MTSRSEFLHDVFVTAIEGGIGYWSECSRYHWENGGGLTDLDLEGFYADITDTEDTDKHYRISRQTISRGVHLITSARGPFYDPNGANTQCVDVPYLDKGTAMCVWAGSVDNDASEIDAGIADAIVQVCLFGEVRYG